MVGASNAGNLDRKREIEGVLEVISLNFIVVNRTKITLGCC